ncbi:DUF29 domain-containing protein [Laspinema sp. A4]|uniref:DUF29 domain-containing protein n=1 Tax=Laspinema sp. D2d TaxID=2953686 RepID=UPI0021BAD76E|nr:DUF29 domain-containing protein [Laspinema sp. D2d]MCT7983230.1 DUF29 domain-containing protein [Laspinema sp. D2d]
MEELLELKEKLLKGDIQGSLALVEELTEIGRKDIIKNIRSYAVILLIHLIKQQVEKRSTRSWDVSIRNWILEIKEENKRPKSAGFYLSLDKLQEVLETAYQQAFNTASLEVEEGRYDVGELEEKLNQAEIIDRALGLITAESE